MRRIRYGGGSEVHHTFVEIDPFCRAVLKKHWPTSIIHEDIKKYHWSHAESPYLLTGGFPCQPFSAAGKKLGTEDDRDLWPEMFRVIQKARPTWIVGENVDDFVEMALDRSISDLESAGYAVQAFIIPAVAVDARHIRDRCWIVAHTDGEGHGPLHRPEHDPETKRQGKGDRQERQRIRVQSRGSGADMADTHKSRRGGGRFEKLESNTQERGESGTGSTQRSENLSDAPGVGWRQGDSHAGRRGEGATQEEERSGFADGCRWPVEPAVGRVAHGIPNRVDRIKSLGNAIVPQVVEEIMRCIKAIEESADI